MYSFFKKEFNDSILSLQVNPPPKPRIQSHLELLQLLSQITHRLFQLGHLTLGLLGRCSEEGLGFGQGELEEGVTDFVPIIIS